MSLLKNSWATALFWLIAVGLSVSERNLTLQFVFWGLGILCLIFPLQKTLGEIAVVPAHLNPAPGNTLYGRISKGIFIGMVIIALECCLAFTYFMVLPDDRAKVGKWLHSGNIMITDEKNFDFSILDADKNPISIFQTQQHAPLITFGSTIQVSDRADIRALDALSPQQKQQMMHDLKSELLKLNLDIDSEANVNWELTLSRQIVLDENLTRQKLLDEIRLINQGVALAKSILDKYLKMIK